jgi:hypothetical protein
MLVLVLCHFRAPVVKNLVTKPGLNSKNWWATAPKSRAAMPVVVWRCRFGIRKIFKCAHACRLSTTSRHEKSRERGGGSRLLRPKISICPVTASSFELSNARVLEAAGSSR